MFSYVLCLSEMMIRDRTYLIGHTVEHLEYDDHAECFLALVKNGQLVC